MPFEVIAKNIRAIGVESTVLGTDFGQAKNIHPVAGMQEYINHLRQAGFKESEIELMGIKNSKALLGI
jgi:microsomal dipeptidase-like Zn-dependent dipeptidase